MSMEFCALRVDVTSRSVASERYTLTRTKGMQLYRLDWFIFNGDEEWDSDHYDRGIEFWAHDDATALPTLRNNLRNYTASGLTDYVRDHSVCNEAVYKWVETVAPGLLDLSQYSNVVSVLETGIHIEYVTHKMCELYDDIKSAGVLIDLIGTNYG